MNVKFESRQGVMSANKTEAIILCQIPLIMSKTGATYCTYICAQITIYFVKYPILVERQGEHPMTEIKRIYCIHIANTVTRDNTINHSYNINPFIQFMCKVELIKSVHIILRYTK